MMLKQIVQYLPRFLVCGLRAAHIHINLRGQTRRDADGNCIDANGNPIPWMTYSAIDFLLSYDLSSCNVFEFGSGSSTLFWKRHCKSVVAVEHYLPWYQNMEKYISSEVSIICRPDLSAYPNEIHQFGKFDIISIDGAERMACARASLEHIVDTGIIILDNSEWYPNTATLFRKHGYSQLDFCGFGPLNSFTSMTSVFFKTAISFPYKDRPLHWTPIGGKPLNHLPPDDV